MKAKFLCSIVSAALFSTAAFAQFPGGGFGGGFQGGGFPGGFGGRFPFDPEQEGQMPGFPGGGGGFGGGFMMGTEYDPTTTRNDVEFTSSNLPIVIIETESKTLTNREKTGATMKVIDNGSKRNKVTDKANGYDGNIKIKLRGNSSLFFDQKRFTFETVTPEGKSNKVELLGMPADNDWVLLAPYNDVSMMRDAFAFDMWNNMGHWAPRTRYCEVVMNGKYIGVYTLCEKIKRGENRIDIAKLKKSDTTGVDITGGYIVRIDPPDENEKSFQSEVPGIMNTNMGGGFGGFGGGMGGFGGFGGRNTVTWTVFYPKNPTDGQLEYISDYVNTVEKVIQSDNFADPVNGYAKYIDVESFVDYFIHTELSLNADGLKRSTYFYKEKQNPDGTGGKLYAGTVWDYNLAYGNCNFANANNIEAWVYEGSETNPTPAMWKRLTEDPAFMAKVKARWKELRKGYLSNDNINKFIDERAALLQESQARQYTKYSDLLVPKREGNQNAQGQQNGGFGGFGGMGGFGGGFPGGGFGGFGGGGGGAGMFSAYTVSSYDEEISILKKWFADRIAFLDKNWK